MDNFLINLLDNDKIVVSVALTLFVFYKFKKYKKNKKRRKSLASYYQWLTKNPKLDPHC